MAATQDRANDQAYTDGQRCAKKGLGITKSGNNDHTAHRRLFDRSFRAFCRGLNRDESFEAWTDGWNDELDRLAHLRAGVFPCGRPI